MKMRLLVLVLSLGFLIKASAQLDNATIQTGISLLPVYDVFKFFPDNKIAGYAVSGNLGFLTVKKMAVGVQPYYSHVKNAYSTKGNGQPINETQQIRLYGLNTYIRYHFISKEKLLVYAHVAAGFGNFEQKTSYSPSFIYIQNSHLNKPIFTFLGGIGMNYFVTKSFALELNVPYFYVNQISTNPDDNDFHSAAPTLGLQFYWK